MKKNYSYIGITFIILIFGIWAVPKIVNKFSKPDLAAIGKVPPYSFTDQNGNTITKEDYKGKVYVVEFFFSTCTDICPIMNKNMVKIQDKFYGNPNFGIASFSIDPSHDTPEVLKKYASKYNITNPNWHLLTGDKEDILNLSNKGFKIYAASNEEERSFEHSGLFALIDKEGNIRSRIDENGNPIIYYDGLEADGVQMIIEDINKLL